MMNLTRNQRRQLDRLASHVDRVIATDLAFFKQPPLGWRWFTLVKKVPGARLRIFVTNHESAETGLDVPEDLVAAVFDTAAPPAVREAEAALRARGRV
jgi:hypothetical protein